MPLGKEGYSHLGAKFCIGTEQERLGRLMGGITGEEAERRAARAKTFRETLGWIFTTDGAKLPAILTMFSSVYNEFGWPLNKERREQLEKIGEIYNTKAQEDERFKFHADYIQLCLEISEKGFHQRVKALQKFIKSHNDQDFGIGLEGMDQENKELVEGAFLDYWIVKSALAFPSLKEVWHFITLDPLPKEELRRRESLLLISGRRMMEAGLKFFLDKPEEPKITIELGVGKCEESARMKGAKILVDLAPSATIKKNFREAWGILHPGQEVKIVILTGNTALENEKIIKEALEKDKETVFILGGSDAAKKILLPDGIAHGAFSYYTAHHVGNAGDGRQQAMIAEMARLVKKIPGTDGEKLVFVVDGTRELAPLRNQFTPVLAFLQAFGTAVDGTVSHYRGWNLEILHHLAEKIKQTLNTDEVWTGKVGQDMGIFLYSQLLFLSLCNPEKLCPEIADLPEGAYQTALAAKRKEQKRAEGKAKTK